MARPGNQNHKKRYERYKNQGRKQENKILKQERAKKREARFAKRREEGKTYVYSPNPYEKGTHKYENEAANRREKNESKKTELQIVTSILRKLQNELDKIAKDEKLEKALDNNRKERNRQSPQINNGGEEDFEV